MDRKHEIRKELEDIAPALSGLKDKNEGFRIPENYFEKMQDEVMNKIKSDADLKVVHRETRTFSLSGRSRVWLKVAGFALVLATAAYFLIPAISSDGSENGYLAGLTPDEATEYVNNNLDEFDLEEMLEVAQVDPSELFTAQPAPESNTQEQIMEEYIDDILDDFDLEELEEML
ncbi:MAG: hypothetical protein DWQ02_14950 [Bacteroidetes bacterium]|nr:MAG: hypothetical protein DWQ02_14950 [Bacteroidota bacterium]